MNKQRVSLKQKKEKEKKKVCCETKLIFRALALRQNEMRISAWCVVHTLYILLYILTYMLGRRYVSGGNVVGEKMNKLVTCFSM